MTSARISPVWGTILLTITIFSLNLPAYAQYSGGTGEPNDPYQIATAADLIALGEDPNDYDKHFILTADIDLDPNLPGRKVFDKAVIAPNTDPNDKYYWFQGTPFTGIFDGSGRVISHLTITGASYLGLFGWLDQAEVENLGVVDARIVGSGGSVGGLVGLNILSAVTECWSTGTVSGGENVGGLVGTNRTRAGSLTAMTHCYSTAAVSGGDHVGGLVGTNGTTITQCFSTGVVSGKGGVGGLVGQNGSLQAGVNLRGVLLWGSIAHCYSTGAVQGDSYVGGLAGLNLGSVEQCYSTGAVRGSSSVGGLFGRALSWNGVSDGIAVVCFWDIRTSGQSTSAGGAGLTTAAMQTAKTFQGWGTCGNESVWTIDEGNDYPRLAWENWPGEAIRSAMLSDLLLGSGTQDDPFLIFTPEELNVIGLYPCEWDKHFKVMADIDLSGFDGTDGRPAFNQIAPGRLSGGWDFRGTPFTGVLDGNGHEIQHLTLTIMDGGCGGLIGGLSGGGEIRDLGVVDVNITSSGQRVGGLVGVVPAWPESKGAVTRCYTTGKVQGNYYVGGIVGMNHGDIAQCYSNATVRGSGGDVGGLVGSNGGVVAQCCSTGTVFGDSYVGGLVGSNGKSMIDGWNGEVMDCYSTAAVTGTGEWGGVGGLVGTNDGSSIIRCYSTGTVAGNKDVGGLVGSNNSSISSSFWDIENSGQSISAGGTGKTTLEMQNMHTYQEAGWDFAGEMQDGLHEIWQMTKGGGYPVLTAFGGYTPPELQGMGTEENPYLISNAIELGAMIHYSSFASYRLADSIDLSGIRWVTSVIPQFDGTFDGDGHTISHLTITCKDQVALFGQLRFGAEVRDVGVVDVNIVGSGDYVGGLVGRNMGIISQCYSSGSVSGGSSVGGLIGWNEYPGAATYCYSTGEVNGIYYVGGLAGRNFGSISSSYSVGGVSGTYNVGGLVGENPVVGMNSEGFWEGSITNCYSSGAVDGKYNVGGLVGSSCWGTGWGCIVAGFWDIQASGQTRSAGGTGKTTAEMQVAKTFLDAGWDFVDETANGTEDIWWILEGQDYPRLWWESLE